MTFFSKNILDSRLSKYTVFQEQSWAAKSAACKFKPRNQTHTMIIWSGLGFLVVVFIFVFGFFFYDKDTWMRSNAPLAYALLLAGLASGILGGLLNKYGSKTYIDKATGKQVTFRRSHSLFFIPVFYWGPILIIGGIYLLIKKH